MKFWIDAQLPPGLAAWLREEWRVNAQALRELGLRDAEDMDIFLKARQSVDEDVVLISKDSDFVELILRQGPPPRLLWVTCGNVSNARLKQVFASTFDDAVALLRGGEAIVEITG